MLTKSILTATAIALAAGVGSASAGERFTTLDGLSIQALSAEELAEISASSLPFHVEPTLVGASPSSVFLDLNTGFGHLDTDGLVRAVVNSPVIHNLN